MLSPDQLESAGDRVAAIYNDIEVKMLDHLVDALISDEALSQHSLTELTLLAQTHTEQLRTIINNERDSIADAVYETAEDLLRASDSDDMQRSAQTKVNWPQQVTATVAGIQLVLDRDNLQMVEGAKQVFLSVSIEAVTAVNTGITTTERALHSAVRKLESGGIPIITYQNAATGKVTVRNRVDVAVRRHIRTQIAQDGMRMTMNRLQAGNITLVEVSSHEDSRPSHAKWQGRCYSLYGEVVIENTRYPDFYTSTRYGSVDGLGGANCRHSFGPYRHGVPRAYDPNPKHPSGLPGSEIYEYEQKQRYLERRIREAKRELRGAQKLYDKDPKNLSNKTALIKAQQKLKTRQEGIRNLINEANSKAKKGTTVLTRKPNREWAGDMPKSAKVSASGRSLKAFMEQKSVKDSLKKNGITQKEFRAGITKEMAKRGGTSKDFASVGTKDQQAISLSVISKYKGRLVKGTHPVEQKDITSLLDNELSRVQFSAKPVINNRISSYGKTTVGYNEAGDKTIVKVEIGKQRLPGRRELADTLLHEELEARIWLNKHSREQYYEFNESKDETEKHAYIQKVVDRFIRLKGIG